MLASPMKWIKNIIYRVIYGRNSVSYFRISFNRPTRSLNGSVDAGVFDADGTTVSSGACWNQSNGLIFSFFVDGKIQWTCFSMTYGVIRTMVGHESTCTDPWPMWPIQKVTYLTHWPITHRTLPALQCYQYSYIVYQAGGVVASPPHDGENSLVRSADLCMGRVRVRVRVMALIDRYASVRG